MKSWLERGAASPHHALYLRRLRIRQTWVWGLRILIFIAFVAVWEGAARAGWIDPFLFSSPSLIWSQAVQLATAGELFHHIGLTSLETAAGFIMGTVGGISLATCIWASPFLSRVLDPYLVILNSMPKVALGPLFIVTLGANGASILAMAVAITIIITTLVIYTRFQSVDESYLHLARSFGATRSQIFRKIIFPACIPDMIAALKVNVGLAWVGVIVGEFLVSKAGLGYLIIYGFQVFNLNLVMLSLVVVAIIATVMYQLIAWLEARLLRHRQRG
ncbi:ABC transporter permease [Laceyella sacchari]|uniref:NitT/TauT family transport system permease protein n=1 Tax=Laceyella tengchongensis TaxID=574699 RepID=A0AA45WKI7_9BACL|nr:ABC transporter permease [Laceyella tengchongensis]AUS08401.1 ABC transporter permease [Laceyella sacchari]SMP06971.1 NitT/TauT family transport system permease protein [Laceyella tengchongensis]